LKTLVTGGAGSIGAVCRHPTGTAGQSVANFARLTDSADPTSAAPVGESARDSSLAGDIRALVCGAMAAEAVL